jgi:hypothetical protein
MLNWHVSRHIAAGTELEVLEVTACLVEHHTCILVQYREIELLKENLLCQYQF